MDEDISKKREYRCGTGYENNTQTEEFINDLVNRGLFEEKGGIMKPGAWLWIGEKKYNVAKMSVDDVKKILTEHNIQF